MHRRAFLRLATIGSAAGCACCLTAFRAIAAETTHVGAAPDKPPHWSYEGTTGPKHWGDLSPDFKVCKLGLEQTPIDLATSVKSELPDRIDIDYRPLPLRILNNGHTIQVNAEPGSACTIGGKRYELQQFHFHHPSEHVLSGKRFDLEVHLVHRANAGDFAVLGVFIKVGARNAALQSIWDVMPRSEAPERNAGGSFDPRSLVPKSSSYFRYMGSLTTPPCSEGLTWTVFREPIEASADQIKQFAALFPNNARPLQGRNRRSVIEANSN
jgi:carbonic anhydrase